MITQVILAFWLVVAYDLLAAIDVIDSFCVLEWRNFFLPVYTFATSVGPLAQSAERGADNAKVVSSSLTRTSTMYF